MDDELRLMIALAALIVSIASLARSHFTHKQQKKENERITKMEKENAARFARINALQGEKEAVAATALHLINDGFPEDAKDRSAIIRSLVQAAIFKRSDRARAIVYAALRENMKKFGSEIIDEINDLEGLIEPLRKKELSKDELDLGSADLRLTALRKVLDLSPRSE